MRVLILASCLGWVLAAQTAFEPAKRGNQFGLADAKASAAFSQRGKVFTENRGIRRERSGSGGGEDGIGRGGGGGGEEIRGGGAGYAIRGGGNVKCTLRQVRDESGACVDATVSKTIFLYESPFPDYEEDLPAPNVPKPKLDLNYVFVRTPEQPPAPYPVVVPPPQRRTLVYVLTRNGQKEQQVIEVPTMPGQPPDVFYVNYNEGDNPLLGGGLTLREVLAHKRRQGQVIRGGSGGDRGRPRNAGTRRPHASSPVQYSH